MAKQTIEQKYRRLSDVEHCLLRPGRYIGSVKPKTAVSWLVGPERMEQREVTWNPGFIKLFDEIISNSVDFSKTTEGKHLDTIKVEIDRSSGAIAVFDNGGIPVELHRSFNVVKFKKKGVDADEAETSRLLESLNGLKFDMHGRDSVSMTLSKSGRGTVTASDIGLRDGVTVSDPSTALVDLGDGDELEMQIIIEYVPSLIFGYLRSGSNFDDRDDSDLTGQNGEGSSLVNIFSTKFVVETCDGKKKFKQTWTKNMTEKTRPQIIEADARGFTKITYVPDYDRLEIALDDDNYAKIVKRVHDVAGCNPKLKVYLNGDRIKINSFRDYVSMYVDEFEYDENGDWQVAVSASDDGFQHVSFVNTTETMQGGTHVAYVIYQIANKIREFLKKKHKVDVKPTDIFGHMRLFVNARVINPRYDSQTKENLLTDPKEYRTSWEPDEKFIQKIIKSNIIEKVLEWVAAKEHAANMAKLKTMNKEADKFNPRRIIKLQDANLAGKSPEKCILFLAEGDSAADPGKSVADRDTMGFLSMRGVPLNFAKAKPEKIAANVETFNIMAAMGLKIGQKVTDLSQLRYSKIALMTDADHDGAGHITGLLVSNLYRFWPELFDLGAVHRFVTPIVKVWANGKNKPPLQFFEECDYRAWKRENPDFKGSMKYYKGLGTSQEHEFREYLENVNDHLIRLEILDGDDSDVIGLVFNSGAGLADKRKKWLNLTEDGDDVDVVLATTD